MLVDFTKEMKKEYTIIAPDIFPTHMDLLQDIFHMYGYNLVVAHYEGKKVIDVGLKYVHNDMCYPAICTLGQQLYALTCGDYDVHKTALIYFQTGGGCRASNYILLLRKALKNMGLGFVPVISISFNQLEKYSGIKIYPSMLLTALRALVYGDMLLLLKNQTAPYEVNKGDTYKTVKYWTKKLSMQFSKKHGLTDFGMRKNLAEMARDFHNIPKISKSLKKVGIVGEIYVQYSSFGNNRLMEFLSEQNCETFVPGVVSFFRFCFNNMSFDRLYYGKSWFNMICGRTADKIASHWEKKIADALSKYNEYTVPSPFKRVKELASKVIDCGVKMGEGWLLPGEASAMIERGYTNIICVQPFGCLPNHIVGKGTIRKLRELYPLANIFPVDYDPGASRVNQENRIKLMLAIADEISKSEKSEEALSKSKEAS